MTDPVNRALFEVAAEYVELVRLYQPQMNARTHERRVTRLLVFMSWLVNRHGVRSLKDVTQDHLTLFIRDAEFGTEWVLGMPQRLVGILQRDVRSGREPPRKRTGRIDLGKIFPSGQSRRLDTPSPNGPCQPIVRWFEAHPGELDTQASPEELIDRMGWRPEPRVNKYVAMLLKPIEEVWAWRNDFLSDVAASGLAVHGITSQARKRGKAQGHYATIPPEVAFAYLRGALQWVVVFAPVFLEGLRLGRGVEEIRKRLASAGLDVVLTGSHRGPRGAALWLNADRFLRLTAAACFAVIAGLSARRIGEIMDLGAGCTFVDTDGHHWIRIYIEKTLCSYEQMPVPAAVHQAVKCLEEISAEARKETGDDSLWQFRCTHMNRYARFDPSRELNTLSRFLPGDLHERWRFHPHQFRRFFAMVYFWRYEPGDVAALAHHLRHFDLEMTRQYVTDGGFGRIWQDVAEERQRDVLASVVDGSRWVGGPAGEQLKKRIEALKRRYRRDVQVVAAKRIVDKLLRLAKKWGSPCKLHVWGTICVCPQKGSPIPGRNARCKGAQERGPVFSQATVATCARCPYAVHTERFGPAARAALAEQENLDAGLSEGTLLKGFVSSACEDLRKALERGEGIPTKAG
ncbi:MAG: tyrosine-type recombinase/integrase [Chloroflexi bacterium]|nr:tyrosine-type recombinase/integrase [Chloroflexota bacterium]